MTLGVMLKNITMLKFRKSYHVNELYGIQVAHYFVFNE
jgi:hypothetical protein